MKLRISTAVCTLFLLMACVSARSEETNATIIYDDRATEISTANVDAGRLWITTVDLKRATGFDLKPQGVCRNELCFPLPKSREQEFVRKSSGKTWFDLVAFAQLVHQPVAHDEALGTWYFGLRSDQRQGLSSLEAPDFTLPDMNGKIHSLSDFRGEKVLLLTWASW
jgi:AhpC/TSA family